MKQIARMMFSPCPECGCSHNMPVCPECLRREIEAARQKRVVMVQHVNGETVADPIWLAEQPQTATPAEAERAARINECGAELEDSPRDWQDMRGDCDL